MNRKRWQLLILWTTVGALLLLVSGLATLAPGPGVPFTLDFERQQPEAVPDLTWLFLLVLGLYVIAVVVFLPGNVQRRMLVMGVFLAILAVGLFWLFQNLLPEPVRETPSMTAPEEPPALAPEEPADLAVPLLPDMEPFAPPAPWVTLVFTFGTMLLLLAGLVAGFWLLRPRPVEADTLATLADEAEAALDSLREGESLRDVVFRCYHEMARVVDETRGVRRMADMTPREFETQLATLGLPQEPVVGLTRLFEAVRYGTQATGVAEERQAVASLTAIVAACRGTT